MKLLRPGALPSLRYSAFAGEALPQGTAEAWRAAAPSSIVDCLYGPTETTVVCTGDRFSDAPHITKSRGIVCIGKPLTSEKELLHALSGSVGSGLVELSKNPEMIAMLWEGASVKGLSRLIRRSAFAQELFLQDSGETSLLEFERTNPSITTRTGRTLVAISWNYIVESEGTLDDPAIYAQ